MLQQSTAVCCLFAMLAVFLLPWHASAQWDDMIHCKFRNLATRNVDLYWKSSHDDKQQELFGTLALGEEVSFGTFPGHTFIWTPADEPGVQLGSLEIQPERLLYVFSDDTTDKNDIEKVDEQLRFADDYYKRTGRHWVAFHPKNPVATPMLTASPPGTRYDVGLTGKETFLGAAIDISATTFLECMPATNWWSSLWDHCATTRRKLSGTWISESPKLLEVEDFVTDFEARELIAEGVLEGFNPSTTGEGKSASTSSARVSESTWISPNRTIVFSNILRRIGATLRLPLQELVPDGGMNEWFELVHFQQGGHSNPHSYSVKTSPEDRIATVIIPLHVQDLVGGGYFFPKATAGELVVAPKRHSAYILYNLLPDGNADERATVGTKLVQSGHIYSLEVSFWDPRIPAGHKPWARRKTALISEL